MRHPRTIQPLLDLSSALRRHRFPVSPDQTVSFIEAVGVLGPNDVLDIRRAALAIFSIPPERRSEFDALFAAIFFDQTVAAGADASDEHDVDADVDAYEPTGGENEVEAADETSETGEQASVIERLGRRSFPDVSELFALRDFERRAKTSLPQRRSYRWTPTLRGDKINLRKSLKQAAKHDGEFFQLFYSKKKIRQRHMLLLIDVSGSMKERTNSTLRFAHSLVHVAERAQVFTLGTRLTRITSALAVSNADSALERVGRLVADIDGGTRIGDTLQAFMTVPRYRGFARGAAVVVLSDGLERGSSNAMAEAVKNLSRLAWHLSWLTPLAADPDFTPKTEALMSIYPFLDDLADGSSIAAICSHVLNMKRAA